MKSGDKVEDKHIIDLFWERSETAISETQKKYGNYCKYISYNILRNEEDAEECVNDTLARAWGAIPPDRPNNLAAFLGKIARNLSLDRYEKYNAEKRGRGQVAPSLDELAECLPGSDDMSGIADDIVLKEALSAFLWSLPAETRKIFMRRYWYLSSIKEISSEYGMGESKVKMILLRTRNKLKKFLEKEGIEI